MIKDGQATGVLVHIEGQGSSEISAREIVLCAGAIHSPAILLRSGIGPADEVKAIAGRAIAPREVAAFNPAFDVTPARYVTAFITERGLVHPPFGV